MMTKAEHTRNEILSKAFEMIYRNGYQATSVDKIIEQTAVTKGAFYYHFKNKEEMGLAVVKEVIVPILEDGLLEPLRSTSDPLNDIYQVIEKKLLNDPDYRVNYGCPTNNLVQEMSPLEVSWHKALRGVLDRWMGVIEDALRRGQEAGTVSQSVDPRQVARFIVIGYEGMKGIGKIYGREIYSSWLGQLKEYLGSLS